MCFCSLLPRLTLLFSFFGHPALPPPRGGSASSLRASPQSCPLDETDSSIQIYHPIFSTNNYDSIASLEIALQTVFDQAKLQLPIAKRVIHPWQFCGHGDNYHTGRPAVAGSIYTTFFTATHEIHQPGRVSGSAAKRARRA